MSEIRTQLDVTDEIKQQLIIKNCTICYGLIFAYRDRLQKYKNILMTQKDTEYKYWRL